MKLADWAKKEGIAYLTAYRWFQSGKLPVSSYQSPSGTIIVQDETDNLEQPMAGNNQVPTDIMSLFLKKTVEFSKNNSSIEDFAAYILSTFSLKINITSESPKYSKNKPRSEDIQKHFQQFIKPKGEKPNVNMTLFAPESDGLEELVERADTLTTKELVEEIHKYGEASAPEAPTMPELSDILKDIEPTGLMTQSIKTYGGSGTEGMISRTVDLNSTPQQFNYTGSTGHPLGTYFVNSNFISSDASNKASNIFPGEQYINLYSTSADIQSKNLTATTSEQVGAFKPTQKELASAKVLEAVPSATRRRGRPSKKV